MDDICRDFDGNWIGRGPRRWKLLRFEFKLFGKYILNSLGESSKYRFLFQIELKSSQIAVRLAMRSKLAIKIF
jgi:hypothetical protein